jgi:hypothetical protein
MRRHAVSNIRLLIGALGIGAVAPATVRAQQPAAAQPQQVVVPTLAPRPEDVLTLDGIINAYYAVITGPPGEPRQWGRDRTLYWPGIRFFAAGVSKDGSPEVTVTTHQPVRATPVR